MILADTSIWISHFKGNQPDLAPLLDRRLISIHAFVVGELSLGNLSPSDPAYSLFRLLPRSPVASDEEVLGLIQTRPLSGRGIGYVDAHLVASALLSQSTLWTRDVRLHAVAEALGVAFLQ